MPLHDGGLEQRSRRIGVVFEELRLAGAVPAEIEAAVQRRLAQSPGFGDQPLQRLGDRELGEAPFAHYVVGRGEAQLVKFRRDRFQPVDLVCAECVAGGLVPVRAAHGVVAETGFLAASAPVGPCARAYTPHAQLPDEWADEPKPPRRMLELPELVCEGDPAT